VMKKWSEFETEKCKQKKSRIVFRTKTIGSQCRDKRRVPTIQGDQ
jgi:hypothetical protein